MSTCCVLQVCPTAWTCIITNPVNSTVPIARKVFTAAGCYNPDRLFGVTTLDCCRANTFVADILGVAAESVTVPVVGGHAGKTILPLLSQCSHNVLGDLDDASTAALVTRIQVPPPLSSHLPTCPGGVFYSPSPQFQTSGCCG